MAFILVFGHRFFDVAGADGRFRIENVPPGTYSASPVLADGHIYVTNEEGLTSVYKAGSKFELVAQNALGDYCLSSIAVSTVGSLPPLAGT